MALERYAAVAYKRRRINAFGVVIVSGHRGHQPLKEARRRGHGRRGDAALVLRSNPAAIHPPRFDDVVRTSIAEQ